MGDAVQNLTDISVAPAQKVVGSSHALVPTRPAAMAGAAETAVTAPEDSYAVTAVADIVDRSLHAATARFTGGLSPAALVQAYLDWATHLAYAPGKRRSSWTRLPARPFASPLRLALRHHGRTAATLHRAAAAGSPLRRRVVAAMAVQFHLSGLSAATAMVAQRHDRHARRLEAA